MSSSLARAARSLGRNNAATKAALNLVRMEEPSSSGAPSLLRERLTKDVEANKARMLNETLEHNTPSSSRLPTLTLAQRLAKQVECQVDPDHPRYLESAMMPSTQCRLIVETRPPYNVKWASSSWLSLANKSMAQLSGVPALEVMQDMGVCSMGGSSIVNSLRLKQRDCGVFSTKDGAYTGRLVISPLMHSKDGSSGHMLFVINGL